MMAGNNDSPAVKPFVGKQKDDLLNTNARIALTKMGRKDWADHMEQVAQANGVPMYQIFTAISRESAFNPNAKAKGSSAAGLGQFTDSTAKQYHLTDKFNPFESIRATGEYLGDLQRAGLNPQEQQQAYMLGLGGFNKMKKGYNNVAGLKDLAGLNKKYNKDLSALGGEGYNLANVKASEDNQAQMTHNPDSPALALPTPQKRSMMTTNVLSRQKEILENQLKKSKNRTKQVSDFAQQMSGGGLTLEGLGALNG